jgi:hypothetical protein
LRGPIQPQPPPASARRQVQARERIHGGHVGGHGHQLAAYDRRRARVEQRIQPAEEPGKIGRLDRPPDRQLEHRPLDRRRRVDSSPGARLRVWRRPRRTRLAPQGSSHYACASVGFLFPVPRGRAGLHDEKGEQMSSPRIRLPWQALALAFAAAALYIAATGAAEAATLPTLSIAVTKTSATVTGTLESGATNVLSTGTGGVKEASLILFLLKPGQTVADAETYVREDKHKGDPNYTETLGSIVFDVEVNSGTTRETQTDLAPGSYVVLLKEGEGRGEAQVRTSFTVAPAKSPAALPAPEATIRTIEFAFRGPSTLHDGELVAFENEGFLVHMNVAFPVKNMKIARKVVKLLRAGKEKGLEKLVSGAPVTFAGPVSHEALQQETITAKPGIYVEACFMDTQDGRSHTQLGMERIIRIVK